MEGLLGEEPSPGPYTQAGCVHVCGRCLFPAARVGADRGERDALDP